MATRTAQRAAAAKRPLLQAVFRVERSNGRVVARIADAGGLNERTVVVQGSRKKRRSADLFSSATLPDTLEKSFRQAVEAARRRYG